ncbi:MAG: helix-turn-helix transcriptional regulator [Sediminibacterium magnilacihabitans]|jgi:transcriptional regulator with XRE-family HTH domain|nr:helix-turn-helix transcriptional regulator [Sediminibacterium magnilacihabitans]PQV60900.1 helix-turn-helix protein [Sediminibacterium magnilacihabitans]
MTEKIIHTEDNWGDDYFSPIFGDLQSKISAEQQEETNYKMKLAAKIYQAMKARGMNQTQFAVAMGERQVSLISRWLSGTHNFTISTLIAVQRVLDITLLDVETTKSQPVVQIKLSVSSPISEWTRFNLDQYISDMGGMAITEKTIAQTVEG